MRFVYGLIVGVASGLGLMFAFANFSNHRAKRRSELSCGKLVHHTLSSHTLASLESGVSTATASLSLGARAAIVQAFAKMTLQDSRKIFTAEELPSWVVFQEKQKLNWLNRQLKKLWPYIDEAASELIRSSVEPILEQYRPAIISSLGFSELTLGTVAPQFTGVQIVDGEPEEIILELEMEWDGNPSFILAVKTLVGVALPVQVKDIAFTGVFRLIFKPLVDEFPCFGALSYSLRQKKKLDFTLKVIGGDLSAIPGISDTLDETIRDAIEDSISWPVRKIIPILPGDYSDLELKPAGTLEVKLLQAKGLANKDLIGKSDPFAALFVRPLRSRTKNSRTINNELNPIWNENFEFVVEDPSTQHLTVRIFDDEGLLPSEFVGCAHVPIKELEPGRLKAVWLKLVKDLEVHVDNKERGMVHLELLYIPFGMKNELIKDFAHDVLKGVLSVTVKSAEELPNLDLFGKSDPYVIVTMKNSGAKMETEVIYDDSNPIWNETFNFDVEDALHEMLIVEVYDHDAVGKNFIGRCIMTLTRVLTEGRYSDTFPLDETESGKLLLSLKWTPERADTSGSSK